MSAANSGRFSSTNLPNPKTDLVRLRFGRLTVISYSHTANCAMWLCRCDCGNETVVRSFALRSGKTKSCGCWNIDARLSRRKYPSETKGRLRNIWHAMLHRCYRSEHPHFKHYGGRGITVCEEWRHDYLAFWRWALANEYTPRLTLDRINNDAGYSPGNCQWVSLSQNHRNTRANVRIAAFGETKTLIEWSEDARCAVVYGRLRERLAAGWEPELAIALPSRNGRNKWSKE